MNKIFFPIIFINFKLIFAPVPDYIQLEYDNESSKRSTNSPRYPDCHLVDYRINIEMAKLIKQTAEEKKFAEEHPNEAELFTAIKENNIKKIKELINKVNFNIKYCNGNTFLMEAIKHKNKEIIKTLLFAGADTKVKGESSACETYQEYINEINNIYSDTNLPKDIIHLIIRQSL